jgi:drug/metabolite transporter (DMT)-like permease
LKADLLLSLTAAIWGTAFVAQRAGMEHVGPFTFNAVRFALGSLSLLPLYLSQARRRTAERLHRARRPLTVEEGRRAETSTAVRRLPLIAAGTLAGFLLFLGSSFQQVGIVYTSAGNAGFITGLYVIIVPLLGLFLGRRPGPGVWAGALCAALGLYLINEAPGLQLNRGDALVLVCALFFAVHVLAIGRFAPHLPALPLSILQFATCALLSGIAAVLLEEIEMAALRAALVPILYGGLGSVGIAYTLQVVAQKEAPPAHAAIILSLESVFAMLGGAVILGEAVPALKAVGALLMLCGMLSAQLQRYRRYRRARL